MAVPVFDVLWSEVVLSLSSRFFSVERLMTFACVARLLLIELMLPLILEGTLDSLVDLLRSFLLDGLLDVMVFFLANLPELMG